VGLSVNKSGAGQVERMVKILILKAYTRSVITLAIGLDPTHVLTAAVTPLGEDLATALESVPGTAADPEKNKGRIGSECGEGKFLQGVPRE
jgi:hypothetical protein